MTPAVLLVLCVIVLDWLYTARDPDKLFFFFFNDTATTEIYTLSLHDALPISDERATSGPTPRRFAESCLLRGSHGTRSEEHTSELQSQSNLVCRLLLEKKKKTQGLRSHKYLDERRAASYRRSLTRHTYNRVLH